MVSVEVELNASNHNCLITEPPLEGVRAMSVVVRLHYRPEEVDRINIRLFGS